MKFWQLFQSLSKESQQQFLYWLKGELMSKKPDYLILLEVILNAKKGPEKEACWVAAFPEKPFNDARYRRLIHELKSRLEFFLAYQAFKEDPDLQNTLYLRRLNQLKLPDLFEKEVRKIIKDLKQEKFPSPTYYQLLYRIKKEIKFHNLQHRDRLKKADLLGSSLNHFFDPWWIHEKFLMACSDDTRYHMYGSLPYTPLLKEAEETIRSHPEFEEMKYLHLMILLLNLDDSYDPSTLYELFEEIAQQREGLGTEEFINLYSYFLNRVSRLLNLQGSTRWAYLLFRLYSWGIDHKYLIHEEALPAGTFRAVIHVGLLAEQPDKVEDLIPIYSNMVLPPYREAVTALCQAKLAFHQGKMRLACRLLVDKKLVDKFLDFESRLLVLQATYELDKDSPVDLEVPIYSLQRYIRYQDSVSDVYKKRFLSCLGLFLQMIKSTANKPKLEQLQTELESCQVLAFRLWLRQKVEDLLGNHLVFSD